MKNLLLIRPCVCLEDGAYMETEKEYFEHIERYSTHRIIPI